MTTNDCTLVTLYGGINPDQYWLRKWLVASWHQAITWTNTDFALVRFCWTDLTAITQRVHKVLLCYNEFEKATFNIIAACHIGQGVKNTDISTLGNTH